MTPLLELLRRRIAVDGPMTVAHFMATALGHPRHGYYMKRDPLGAAGDFTTAPEISQMFGELVGLWLVDCWDRLGRPAPVRLVELGPGRGTLIADAVRAARVMPAFLDAIRIDLVETSPPLRTAQQAALAALAPRWPPVWHDRLADIPDGPMLAVANEFFDALPIRQFQRVEDGWRERLVGWDVAAGGLRFELAARPDPVAALVPSADDGAPPGTIVELCTAGLAIADDLGRRVAESGGAAIVIDYGAPAPVPADTLQAVRRHQCAEPLAAPGDSDLTAHVDFAGLAAAARQAGAVVHGPVAQGAWLDRLGIAGRGAALKAGASARQAVDVDAALARLTAPEAMGTLFNIMAIADRRIGVPAGFDAPG